VTGGGRLSRWWARRFERRRKAKTLDEPHYKKLELRGEQIYEEMYETSSPSGYLSEIKECFEAAIAAAESDRLTDEAQRLQSRLDHIVTVYRRQFT
jgi:hypothetical protein